jgi:hypothetical protein
MAVSRQGWVRLLLLLILMLANGRDAALRRRYLKQTQLA